MVPLLTSAGHYADVRAAPGARAEPPLRRGPAPANAAGGHSFRRSLRWWRGEWPSCCGSRASTGTRPRSRWWGTAPAGIRRAGAPTLQLAETLRRRRVAGEVLAGVHRRRSAGVGSDARVRTLPHLVVVPFLIGGGTHVEEDIPRLLLATRDSRLATAPLTRPSGIIPASSRSSSILPGVTHRRRRPASGTAELAPSGARQPGAVHLVGAGPGDPGLITARGLELLRRADVVVHDRLIGAELLGEARADALLIDVGKGPGHAAYSQTEINALLVEHAETGRPSSGSRAAIRSSSGGGAKRPRPAARRASR